MSAHGRRHESAGRHTLRVVQNLSEEGFGVSLTPVGSRTFFVFRLKVGDDVLGDGEPAIEWASADALSRLRSVEDPRVDPDRQSAHPILDRLTSDIEEELHDRTLNQFGESLDRYSCHAYLWGDEAELARTTPLGMYAGHQAVGDRALAWPEVTLAFSCEDHYEAEDQQRDDRLDRHVSFAQGASGITSVGLKAIELVRPR